MYMLLFVQIFGTVVPLGVIIVSGIGIYGELKGQSYGLEFMLQERILRRRSA